MLHLLLLAEFEGACRLRSSSKVDWWLNMGTKLNKREKQAGKFKARSEVVWPAGGTHPRHSLTPLLPLLVLWELHVTNLQKNIF